MITPLGNLSPCSLGTWLLFGATKFLLPKDMIVLWEKKGLRCSLRKFKLLFRDMIVLWGKT